VIYLKFVIIIDKICDYFGIKIAIYFAWLGFYTRALLIPALLGLAMYLSMGNDEVENFLNIIYEKN
jgi:anoctamin-8